MLLWTAALEYNAKNWVKFGAFCRKERGDFSEVSVWGFLMHWPSCPLLCVAVRVVASRFTDVRKTFRTQGWQMNWTNQWWICCAKAKCNLTKLWCVVENSGNFLGGCAGCKVSEPSANETHVSLESHIPKLKGAVFPAASWKADTAGGKQGNGYKSSSCVCTSVSLVSEYKPRYELRMRWTVACPLSCSAPFSRFRQLAFPNVAVSSTGMISLPQSSSQANSQTRRGKGNLAELHVQPALNLSVCSPAVKFYLCWSW